MDFFGDKIAIIIAYLILLGGIALIGLLYYLNDAIYPDLNISSIINQGSSQDGVDGNDANDGNLNNFGTAGIKGPDGVQGLPGVKGPEGNRGAEGDFGINGAIGLQGQPGVVGEPGLPSNSKVSLIEKYQLSESTTYVMRDSLIFGDSQYQVSMYANVDDNNRFVLPANTTVDDSVASFQSFTDPNITEFEGINFFSTLRVIIGVGRGKHNSRQKSDDTIIYVGPPITRNTRLLRYKLLPDLPEEFGRVDLKYPTTIANNTFDFIFVPTKTEIGVRTQRYHLMYGVSNYDLVVNTFPPLPGNFNFSYRIVEQFGLSFPGSEFPSFTLPFDSVNLSYRDDDMNILTISNRFDMDRVVERRLTAEKYPWKQTNKRTVEINTIENITPVLFENTYLNLKREFLTNKNLVDTAAIPALATDPLPVSYNILFFTGNDQETPGTIEWRLRKYTPSVPLDRYFNLEKAFLSFFLLDTEGRKYEVVYGKEYDFDRLDFQNIYSRIIYLSRSFTRTGNDFTESDQPSTSFNLDYNSPVTVGYTTVGGDRFTAITFFQGKKSDDFLFINIPPYGYKKV